MQAQVASVPARHAAHRMPQLQGDNDLELQRTGAGYIRNPAPCPALPLYQATEIPNPPLQPCPLPPLNTATEALSPPLGFPPPSCKATWG